LARDWLSELLLFSCLAAFIVGIVVAAASLLRRPPLSGGSDMSGSVLCLMSLMAWTRSRRLALELR
jgi:hypothetical protein